METLSITTIIWFIILGAVTGFISGLIMRKEGATVNSNILWGITGAVVTGVVCLFFEISGVLLYAFIGTLAFLFIVNMFHLHHIEDIIGSESSREPDREL